MLSRKGLLIDFVPESKVEQAVLLGHQERRLPQEFLPLGAGIRLGVPRLGGKDSPEPVTDIGVFHPHPTEGRQHLSIELGFGDPNPRVTHGGVSAAPVVDVPALAGGLGGLRHLLTRHSPSAMTAGHELAGERHLVGVVDVPAEKGLDSVPGRTIDKRLLIAGIPLPFVRNLSDVRTVRQHAVELAPCKARDIVPIHKPFALQAVPKCIECERFVRVEVKETSHIRRRGVIDFGNAPAFLADVPVA